MLAPLKSREAAVELSDPGYGSDKHGLLWAYAFAPGQSARQLDSAAAVAWLAQPDSAAGHFLWLHFALSNAAAERWLRANLQLPDSFYATLREDAVSTRVELEDAVLVASIHDVRFDSSFEASDISSVSLYVGPRVVISARMRPLRSVDRLRASIRGGSTFNSPAELLGQLLREQAGVLTHIVRQSTAAVDLIEDRLLANRITSSRRELGSLRRSLVRLQRLLAPEPAALFRLLSRPPVWINEVDLTELRQAAEEFSAAVTDAASLAERVRLIQEEFAALINERTGRTLFVLTVVTVLALPINMVAGLFGMNVGGIPLATAAHGFALIVVLLVLVTALLGYLAFGRRDD